MKEINIYEIEKEYENVSETLWVDDNRMYRVKSILNDGSVISKLDKRIFLLYLEMGSLRKAANVCGISHKTINEIYHKVKNIIIDKLKE